MTLLISLILGSVNTYAQFPPNFGGGPEFPIYKTIGQVYKCMTGTGEGWLVKEGPSHPKQTFNNVAYITLLSILPDRKTVIGSTNGNFRRVPGGTVVSYRVNGESVVLHVSNEPVLKEKKNPYEDDEVSYFPGTVKLTDRAPELPIYCGSAK